VLFLQCSVQLSTAVVLFLQLHHRKEHEWSESGRSSKSEAIAGYETIFFAPESSPTHDHFARHVMRNRSIHHKATFNHVSLLKPSSVVLLNRYNAQTYCLCMFEGVSTSHVTMLPYQDRSRKNKLIITLSGFAHGYNIQLSIIHYMYW